MNSYFIDHMMSTTRTRKEVMDMDDKMIGSFVMMAIFVAFTAYMINFITSNTSLLDDSGFNDVFYQLLLGATFLVLLALVANYKALDFLQDHALAILIWSYRLMFFSIIGFFAILGIFISPIFLIFAILVVAFYFWIWDRLRARIERAAEWLTMSATIVLNEPGMILLSFIQSIVIGIAGITGAFSLYAWNTHAEANNISQENSDLIVYGILFLYLWITLFVIYYFDGANTFIAYSRLKGEDPKIGQGLNAATHKIPSLFFFALISTIVTVIVQLIYSWARKIQSPQGGNSRDSGGTVILSIVASILAGLVQWLYHLISFFTLPSIIIRQNGLNSAMRESYDLFRGTYWDLIVSDTGFNFGSRIMYIIVAIILAVGGFSYGYLVGGKLIWGVVVGVLGLIIGLLMTKFFLRPLYISLVTTIYVYATEGSSAVKIMPSKLTNHLDYEMRQPHIIRN